MKEMFLCLLLASISMANTQFMGRGVFLELGVRTIDLGGFDENHFEFESFKNHDANKTKVSDEIDKNQNGDNFKNGFLNEKEDKGSKLLNSRLKRIAEVNGKNMVIVIDDWRVNNDDVSIFDGYGGSNGKHDDSEKESSKYMYRISKNKDEFDKFGGSNSHHEGFGDNHDLHKKESSKKMFRIRANHKEEGRSHFGGFNDDDPNDFKDQSSKKPHIISSNHEEDGHSHFKIFNDNNFNYNEYKSSKEQRRNSIHLTQEGDNYFGRFSDEDSNNNEHESSKKPYKISANHKKEGHSHFGIFSDNDLNNKELKSSKEPYRISTNHKEVGNSHFGGFNNDDPNGNEHKTSKKLYRNDIKQEFKDKNLSQHSESLTAAFIKEIIKIIELGAFDKHVKKNNSLLKGHYRKINKRDLEIVSLEGKLEKRNKTLNDVIFKDTEQNYEIVALGRTRTSTGVRDDEKTELSKGLDKKKGEQVIKDGFSNAAEEMNTRFTKEKNKKDADKRSQKNDDLGGSSKGDKRKNSPQDLKNYFHEKLDDSNELIPSQLSKEDEKNDEIVSLEGIDERNAKDEYKTELNEDHDDDEIELLKGHNITKGGDFEIVKKLKDLLIE